MTDAWDHQQIFFSKHKQLT